MGSRRFHFSLFVYMWSSILSPFVFSFSPCLCDFPRNGLVLTPWWGCIGTYFSRIFPAGDHVIGNPGFSGGNITEDIRRAEASVPASRLEEDQAAPPAHPFAVMKSRLY